MDSVLSRIPRPWERSNRVGANAPPASGRWVSCQARASVECVREKIASRQRECMSRQRRREVRGALSNSEAAWRRPQAGKERSSLDIADPAREASPSARRRTEDLPRTRAAPDFQRRDVGEPEQRQRERDGRTRKVFSRRHPGRRHEDNRAAPFAMKPPHVHHDGHRRAARFHRAPLLPFAETVAHQAKATARHPTRLAASRAAARSQSLHRGHMLQPGLDGPLASEDSCTALGTRQVDWGTTGSVRRTPAPSPCGCGPLLERPSTSTALTARDPDCRWRSNAIPSSTWRKKPPKTAIGGAR